MKKTSNSLTFRCPACEETFEFDDVGEFELVPCPVCGVDFMTIRKGKTLQLECLDFNTKILSATSVMIELEC
jgi:Zn finger protein HypA/HybF involved in hydrogenase expression